MKQTVSEATIITCN